MIGHGRLGRRALLGAALLLAAGGMGVALAQPNLGEKKVDPVAHPLDKDKQEVWTLHFRYKPIRIVTLDGIGKDGKPEKKVVWYMWYQVYNLPPEDRDDDGRKDKDGKDKRAAGQPVTFLPQFDLVTKDYLLPEMLDEPQPYIVEQLRKLEDPTGVLNLQTTISISKRPIPVSAPEALPKVVSGLAIWTDMADKAPKTNKFSVYIAGLSNGVSRQDLVSTNERIVKRKTLQINFVRPTDDNRPQVTDIRPDDSNNLPAEQWIYRTSSRLPILNSGLAPKMPPGP